MTIKKLKQILIEVNMLERKAFDLSPQDRGICIIFTFAKTLSALLKGTPRYEALLEKYCEFADKLITVQFDKSNINNKPFKDYTLLERVEILSVLLRHSKGHPYSGFDVNHKFLFEEFFPFIKTEFKLTNVSISHIGRPDFDSITKTDSALCLTFHHNKGVHIVACGFDTDYYIVDPNFVQPYTLVEMESRYGPCRYGDCLLISISNP